MTFRHFCFLLSAICIPTSSGPACTIGAFGTSSTADGRPILWKNRDVKNEHQEMRYFSSGRYRFVANVYAGETLDVWAGINEAGFAIMNSNSFNIGGKEEDGKAADDGNVMRLALDNCATVGDFVRLMDSLNVVGRQTAANYGVFDASGKTAIFEAANTYYVRYDADQESLGIVVRANYSYHGDTVRRTGKGRHDRAWQLVAPVARQKQITAEFVAWTLARDMGTVSFDPYPLPFYGTFGSLPFGYISAETTVCRTTTRSVQIMVGPKPGADPAGGMMWTMLGPPEAAGPVPLWVQGGPVPELLNGPERARICDEAIALRAYVRAEPQYPEAANTFGLYRVLESLLPAESTVFSRVRRLEAERPNGPGAAEAGELTELACRLTLDAVDDFWDQFYSPKPGIEPDTGPSLLPVVSRNRLVIRLPEGSYRAIVYDALGRLTAELAGRPGDTRLYWKPTGLAAGRYFIRFPGYSAPAAGFVYVP